MPNQPADHEQEYDSFIDNVRQNQQVWGLTDKQGNWAICPSASYEDTDVLPFWSSQERAQALCTDDWNIYQPTPIALDDFLIDWLPGMHEDDALVGPDWNTELEGLEIEPMDLAKELELAAE